MYNFYWYEKENNIKKAYEPSIYKLVEDKESSKNWNDTENLYIEGDNLEVLKLLQKSYFGKIKIIYIDPPYNTGNDFIYKDNFRDNISNYKKVTNQNFKANPETNGRYHTDWLNMVYPRLRLARNLLEDDGIIFISIGEDELANLKKVCDEVFGSINYIANCTRIAKRTSNKGTYFRPTKDYVLVYARDLSKIDWKFGVEQEINMEEYKYEDEYGRYKKNGASLYQPSLDSRPNQRYWIECPDGSFIIPPGTVFPNLLKDGEKVKPKSNNDKVWRWSVDTYLQKKDKLIFTPASSTCPLIDSNGKPSKWNVYDKVYLSDKDGKTLLPEDVIYDFVNSQGTKELLNLDMSFSFSKPSDLIKYLIKLSRYKKDIIVLDFFSGSASTAHAVMKLNAEDEGKRKFIMVQLPEQTEEKSEAYKAGYKNICEIGKERIRRAGDKILSENKDKEGIKNLDIGFKVFKLEVDNMKTFFENNYNEDSIKVDWILKPKGNVLEKIKINNELYYIVESENNYIVYSNNSKRKEGNKTYYIASIFNKNDCKDIMYHQLEGYYVEKLIEFNQGWYHDNYVTCRILDEAYKYLNK